MSEDDAQERTRLAMNIEDLVGYQSHDDVVLVIRPFKQCGDFPMFCEIVLRSDPMHFNIWHDLPFSIKSVRAREMS